MKKKKLLWLFLLIALLTLLVSTTVYGWLFVYRRMDLLGQVKAPIRLELRAGALESIQEFSLGEIDVSTSSHSQNYVFAVFGDKEVAYKLQLAYTTNIPFSYNLYSAEQFVSEQGGAPADVVYTEHKAADANTYYYYKKEEIPCNLLNLDINSNLALENGEYHNKTYGESESDDNAYANVQIHAEPLYLQSKNMYHLGVDDLSEMVGDYAVAYYILTVSWTQEQLIKEQIANNKETDLIYLTIGQEKRQE